MTIFFTAAYRGKNKYQHYYNTIIETIKNNQADIISLEVQKHEDIIGKKLISQLNKNEIHYLYTRKGINKANAVIIEASVNSFQLGHEATLSLMYNKPVLCVSSQKDYSVEIKHPNFYAELYSNEKQLAQIVANFINEVKNKHLSVRFNAFLSPDQKNFLDWYNTKYHQNASEFIRDLIKEKIAQHPEFESDTQYFISTKEFNS